MIASEQISVLFVKIPLLLLRKIRAIAACQDLLTRLYKIQLQSGQLILQIRRCGKIMRSVEPLSFLFHSPQLFIVLLSSGLQTLHGGILDQAHSMRQKEGSLSLPDMRLCHSFLFWHFLLHYFTAPVIPFAKLFCKHRKMIAVGSVQINTPSISIP